VREVFGIYLSEWRASARSQNSARRFELRLLSKAGTWVPAADLVAGVHGVMPELVVNDRQFESLGGIAVDNRSTPTLEPADVPGEEGGAAQEQLLQSLEEYFEPLVSSSVKPAAGAVIGLLRRAGRLSCEELARPHCIRGLSRQTWLARSGPRGRL
jgi:hypothetical protein